MGGDSQVRFNAGSQLPGAFSEIEAVEIVPAVTNRATQPGPRPLLSQKTVDNVKKRRVIIRRWNAIFNIFAIIFGIIILTVSALFHREIVQVGIPIGGLGLQETSCVMSFLGCISIIVGTAAAIAPFKLYGSRSFFVIAMIIGAIMVLSFILAILVLVQSAAVNKHETGREEQSTLVHERTTNKHDFLLSLTGGLGAAGVILALIQGVAAVLTVCWGKDRQFYNANNLHEWT